MLFTGFTAEPNEFIANSHAHLFLSSYPGESFPNVVLECLSAGIPQIVTPIGEVPYMITDDQGTIGEVVSLPIKGISEDLISAMTRIATLDHDLWQEMSLRAMKQSQRFSMESMSKKYFDLFYETHNQSISQSSSI